ncbi:MAG TPA: class II aldolase/adducin family protein [Stellaceae bacterium]|jgi:ribulose-5-phosphate 4-epimerase/fuculose-1-phosphate aldolase|nr:class II aldolase/adducin family protein [Stellaceae bacterium]
MSLAFLKDSPTITAAEWQARVDLAAAHRLAVTHGFSEGIFNHLTLAVPGKTDRYYQIPFGMHWSEVTASCFMEVGWDGTVLAGEGEVERSAYCIHAPIHRLVPQHACVLHTHMPYASALARLEEQEILPIGQTEIGFLDKIAYDDTYTGPALDPEEGERLAGILGPDKKILFMANHGVCVCGGSVAEAYDLLYYLERAAQVQIYAMWTGRKLREVKPAVVTKTLRIYDEIWPGYKGKPPYEHHFAALKRLLDRNEPDYAD